MPALMKPCQGEFAEIIHLVYRPNPSEAMQQDSEGLQPAKELRVVEVQKDGTDGILVAFSDGTVAGYVLEELIELRPFRETGTCEPGTLRAVQHPIVSDVAD
jgi:hypothetical protein